MVRTISRATRFPHIVYRLPGLPQVVNQLAVVSLSYSRDSQGKWSVPLIVRLYCAEFTECKMLSLVICEINVRNERAVICQNIMYAMKSGLVWSS